MSTNNHRVDVHYHIIPRPYVEVLADRGITGSTYVKFPRWTPDLALKRMDRDGVETALTSLSTPGVWFGDRVLARELSRLCNEFQARMVSDFPGRFGSLAILPLPDVDAALEELEYALDELGHDGVVLLASSEDRYLGDPAYEELFAELDRRETVVFIHPHSDPSRKRRYEIFDPLMEWPFRTTRAAMELLYSGRLVRYPGVRYILAHGGGAIPFLANRIARGAGNGRISGPGDGGAIIGRQPAAGEALDLLGTFYFDTAAPGEAHLAALQEFAGGGRILFGTDGGWTQPIQTALAIKELLAYGGFDQVDLQRIESGNAASLFPRFARESPAVSTPPKEVTPAIESRHEASTPPPRPGADPPALDVHHHMVPAGYREALRQAGLDTSGLPDWSLEASLEMMDRVGIGRALLSISSPGVWLGDDAEARSLARTCNEFAASLVSQNPTRIGALATLPFPDLEGSVGEAGFALDTLGLDGVILLSNVDGKYVGDPEFDPLMAELHRLEALVFLHPNHVPAEDENAALHGWPEYPLDVARAYARLVHNDVLLRYPGIRWVLAHAGGAVPYMAERLGKAHYANQDKLRWGRIIKDLVLKRNGGLELAKGVGYEVSGAVSPVVFTALRRLVEPDRIHFGTNFPWDPEEVVS